MENIKISFSPKQKHLDEIAEWMLEDKKIPMYGEYEKFQKDTLFNKNHLFFEYFDGDTGKGLGANHQTGWTGLIAEIIWHLNKEEDKEE